MIAEIIATATNLTLDQGKPAPDNWSTSVCFSMAGWRQAAKELAELQKAYLENKQLRALLKQSEWEAFDDENGYYCWCCQDNPHLPNCRLAAALKEHDVED